MCAMRLKKITNIDNDREQGEGQYMSWHGSVLSLAMACWILGHRLHAFPCH